MHECKADLLDMLTVCTACNRALIRERDKQCVTKAIVSELIQAIKFKCEMHEHNYMAIVELVLQDAGETVSKEITDDQVHPDYSLLLNLISICSQQLTVSLIFTRKRVFCHKALIR
ncbi:unnamed protein product [Anisakis simplex]|uniref:Uncoordinated protein 79 (inferred by orthology to a C. elegans protein) n=1 Tax=Anisakis simplex TaxID=6269 RepID=A0A0M3JCQ8_ANISI|nr:unnamed protein product [Anisakis simplex]